MDGLAKLYLKLKKIIFKGIPKSSLPLPLSLLSPATYKNVVFGFSWGSFWGGTPFEYDISLNRIQTSTKSIRKWRIVTTCHCIYFVYLISVLIYLSLARVPGIGWSAKSPLNDNAFCFIVTMMSLCLLIFNITVGMSHKVEFCSFINRELRYCIFLKETYTNKLGGKWRNGCEEFMLAYKALLIFPLFASLHSLQYPEKMFYMTSFIPKQSPFYGIACICNSLVILGLQLSGLGTVFGIFFPILGFVYVFLNIILEIRPGRAVYRTKPSFRSPEALRLLIRSMQLLAIQINVMGDQILMLEQSLMTSMGTVCVFSAIHFWSGLTISGRGILVYSALVSIGVWTSVLTVAAQVYTITEKSLNSWRNFTGWSPSEKKEMKKYRISVRPIQLQFGGFYHIRPKKILSFWNTLVWLIVRSLLTFPVSH